MSVADNGPVTRIATQESIDVSKFGGQAGNLFFEFRDIGWAWRRLKLCYLDFELSLDIRTVNALEPCVLAALGWDNVDNAKRDLEFEHRAHLVAEVVSLIEDDQIGFDEIVPKPCACQRIGGIGDGDRGGLELAASFQVGARVLVLAFNR